MQNNLTMFKFENTKVEIIKINNELFFNAHNIGECLGIDEITVRRHIQSMSNKQVVKITNKLISSDTRLMNIRKLNNAGESFLTERGIYKLCFRSRKPEAEKFQDWVCDEVLPSIRKHGIYKVKTSNFSLENLASKVLIKRLKTLKALKIPDKIAIPQVVKEIQEEIGFDYTPYLALSKISQQIKDTDTISEFITEKLEKNVGKYLTRESFREAYVTWSTKKGYIALTARLLGKELKVRGIKSGKKNINKKTVYIYKGIKLI